MQSRKEGGMKILVFTYSLTRNGGGLFHAVRDLFTNKAFEEHQLKIFAYEEKDMDEDIATWKSLPIQLFHPGLFLYSHKAKASLLRANTDIFHMEGLWRYPQILMGVWKAHRNEPIVCSPHGMLAPYIIKNQGLVKRCIARLFFQKGLAAVDCYHALCESEMKEIRAYGLKQPIAVIPNGINMPDPDLHFEKSDSKKHLLYLGRLHKKKGVDLLLKAFASLKKSNPNLVEGWLIDIVGWDHENCKSELEQIVVDNYLGDSVVFHGGLFGEDKQRMYAIADGYILPSHSEGLPMTVLEAWSWKVPALITPECHLPEGYEADAVIKIEDNVSSVEQGLIKFFSLQEDERKQIGLNGYELVRHNFTWDVSAQKMLQVYDWLLGKADQPAFVHLVKTNSGGVIWIEFRANTNHTNLTNQACAVVGFDTNERDSLDSCSKGNEHSWSQNKASWFREAERRAA